MGRAGIVHRDLKPENIIVSHDLSAVKIVDLGLATSVYQDKYIFVRCGTPGYVAP
jgi:serine/threonine protein kinase